MYQKRKITIPFLNGYAPTLTTGNFGIYLKSNSTKYTSWYSCRDTFQGIDSSVLKNGLFFVLSNSNAFDHPDVLKVKYDRIDKFLTKIETKLNLKSSKIYKTNRDNVVYIKLNSFWLKNKIRRSFLTGALRCSVNWNKRSSVQKTMPDYNEKAVQYFLKGKTKLAHEELENTHGWRYLFTNATTEKIKKMLV